MWRSQSSNGTDLIVETIDGHPAVERVQAGHQARDRGGGIGHGTAEKPGVEVAFRAAQDGLAAGDAAQAVAERGHAGSDHAGVGNGDDVAAEFVAMVEEERSEAGAADFLLAFEQEDQIHRQFAAFAQRFLDTQHMGHHLALVVGGTARPDPAIADFRLKRIAGPQVQRIDRLHVIVTVNEHRAAAGHMGVAGDDHRVFRRFVELGREAHPREFRQQPLGAGTHVRRMTGIRRNAREAQERKQISSSGVTSRCLPSEATSRKANPLEFRGTRFSEIEGCRGQ